MGIVMSKFASDEEVRALNQRKPNVTSQAYTIWLQNITLAASSITKKYLGHLKEKENEVLPPKKRKSRGGQLTPTALMKRQRIVDSVIRKANQTTL